MRHGDIFWPRQTLFLSRSSLAKAWSRSRTTGRRSVFPAPSVSQWRRRTMGRHWAVRPPTQHWLARSGSDTIAWMSTVRVVSLRRLECFFLISFLEDFYACISQWNTLHRKMRCPLANRPNVFKQRKSSHLYPRRRRSSCILGIFHYQRRAASSCVAFWRSINHSGRRIGLPTKRRSSSVNKETVTVQN